MPVPYVCGLQAMKGFQRLQMLAAAAGALCMLALSSVLGRGAAPLSAAPVGLLLGANPGNMPCCTWLVTVCQVTASLT